MPDQDDAASAAGGDDADPALAAARLERALDRIADSAQRVATAGRGGAAEPIAGTAGPPEVAARLDALIAQLRTALDRN